jgi:hypothetical protein
VFARRREEARTILVEMAQIWMCLADQRDEKKE